MDKKQLKQFLLDSNAAGYAGGEDKKWIKETDGSTTIPFEKGAWKSNDNFFGGEPYGGRVIVSYQNKPVWMMVYYGWVADNIEANPIYAILRSALKQMPQDAPYRGPKEFKDGDLIYANTWVGEVGRYSGEEKITQNGKIVYKSNYFGGLVDKSRGL